MFTNINPAFNGAPITDVSVAPFQEKQIIAAQKGDFDSSTLLSTFLQLNPQKNMMLLQSKWDEQVMKRNTFSATLYNKVVMNKQVITVNGNDGGSFKYKIAVETDNCMRTTDDTSYQAVDGYVGADGTSFLITLNRKVSPGQTISTNPLEDLNLVVTRDEVDYLSHGYQHRVVLLGSKEDSNKVYPAYLLKADVTYSVGSGSYFNEYGEELANTHFPASTNYMECEFRLGSGQGYEHWFTGKANSYKMQTGYTTADTQNYLADLYNDGYDGDKMLSIRATMANGTKKDYIADVLEMMTIKAFNKSFSKSLMFMTGAKYSDVKGSLEFNEGVWQQLRRGKIYKYNQKGGFTLSDIVQVRNYVYLNNDSVIEETFLNIDAGSELYTNLESIIQYHANKQIVQIAPLLGSSRVLPDNPVTGSLTDLRIAPVKFSQATLPGVGEFRATRDTSLDRISDEIDIRQRGINPGGKDYTTYSGFVWDVTDQKYSNNAKFPEGTTPVGGETRVAHNMYLVQPEKPLYWGRDNGRYSSQKVSDIVSSKNLMGEGFWIYGFGAMWIPDPSKIVMIELKQRSGGIR